MKQAIGYIRVSTEKQANEGVSLEAQEAKIVSWCKTNGYDLVKVYIDAGVSGKRMDTRKELLAALNSLKKGMALVSYSLSRLARSTKMHSPLVRQSQRKKPIWFLLLSRLTPLLQQAR